MIRCIHIYRLILALGIVLFWSGPLGAQEGEEPSCSDCHEDIILEGSVHEGILCGDCHSDVLNLGIEEHQESEKALLKDVCEACGGCHETARDEWLESVHGISLYKAGSEKEAAHCFSCHGSHDIRPASDPDSKVYPTNLAHTCGVCHAKPELVAKYNIPDLHPVELFSRSYHAKKLAEGPEPMAATCNDCHGVHDIKISTDPTSSISHSNIAWTCGTCHQAIFGQYSRSVHWSALARGERESPACVDCHGEHEILLPIDPAAPVSKRRAAELVCARCHINERLIKKYGLTEGKVSSYQDSYHGLAVLQGDWDAATCYDCHNAHEILPASDEESSIHLANLVQTCSSCHPGASVTFAQSYTHQSVILAERPVEYYVKIVYIVLIIVVIGAMVIHNGIIFWDHLVEKFKHHRERDYIQRYSPSEVCQHYILIISFFTLVITGFALKFPEVFWVRALAAVGLTEPLRSLVHRIAAVVMIGLGIWHTGEILTFRRGRHLWRAFLPGRKDFSHFIATMKYHLTRSAAKPSYGRFDYTEKVEYWALVWGTVIMIITGLILWFPIFFGQLKLPWLIKVSETIHYYEAWLATLAIFIWHFFFVLFHPQDYPMSMTWLHGKMSLEEYRHKHPEELKKIIQEVEAVRQGIKGLEVVSYQAREYVRRHPDG